MVRALLNGWKLISSGEWPTLLYRLQIKWTGVDLGFVSTQDLGLADDRSLHHVNSGGPNLDIVLKTLPISAADEILDFGCGKGGAMLTLSKYPYARVDGVELSESMASIGRDNLRRMNAGKCHIYQCDAVAFTDLDRYNHFYLYYPFPRSVTKLVMDNVIQSLERRPRQITLIFINSVDHDLILTYGFRVEGKFGHFPNPCPAYTYSLGPE